MDTSNTESVAPVEIELDRLGRCFSGKWALRGLSGAIASGAITAVLGANGAGKSTLLKLLAGELPVTEGEIRFDGRRLRLGAISLRRKVLLLGEIANGQARGSNYVASLLRDYNAVGDDVQDRVVDWISRFGLLDHSHQLLRELSKGQGYKIALSAMLSIAPPIWLLDEPMSAGLDASGMRFLEEAMRRHAGAGGTVVFSSQWPQHAVRLADQAIVLHCGRKIWQGDIGQSLATVQNPDRDESLQAVLDGLATGRVDDPDQET